MMNKEQFRQWIFNNYNVGDNTTMAPNLLDAILDYAERFNPKERKEFFVFMLSDIVDDFGEKLFDEVIY